MDGRQDKALGILASWRVTVANGQFYTSSMHFLYLEQMVRLFKRVVLLAPQQIVISEEDISSLSQIPSDCVEIVALPYSSGHIEALSHWKTYRRVIKEVADRVDIFYCRVPDPFAWMPAQLTDKSVIMHFVGDTADATKNNTHFSWLKKKILLVGYALEYRQILKSAARSKVYTNGTHLAEMLRGKGIEAYPVVSSTITKRDMPTYPLRPLVNVPLTLVYVGYLRYAKGIDTLIEMLKILDERQFDYQMHVVGDGDMMPQLQQFCASQSLPRLTLHGHINERSRLLSILRCSDLFFFPSLSEGSPRVVIEAMSQGCAVLSTPVGSLPGCFSDGKDIYFFPFSDANAAANRVIDLSKSLEEVDMVRHRAYERVCQDFLIDQFISRITQP